MAEVQNGGDTALPRKQNPDLSCPESKKQRLEYPDQAFTSNEHRIDDNGRQDTGAEPYPKNGVVQKRKEAESQAEAQQGDEEEAEESDGKAIIDRKGKGILIQEDDDVNSDEDEDNDSDDDSSGADGGGKNLSDGESDLSDDPLAEVDLHNNLPSRTRRWVAQPGAYIANDMGSHGDDDSDA